MEKDCTIYKTADFIGKRWTLLILLELYKGNKIRYSRLKNNLIGMTPKILSLRLKELEKEKLIRKDIDTSQFPIKCEYSLTKSGTEFIKIIQNMKKWALKWKIKNKVCNNTDCRHCDI